MDNYQKALSFIHGRRKFKKSPTLRRMQLLMDKLNNPEKKLNMVHVAGTNGKGSTIAFLRNIFQASGLSVGTFTSPFLIKFNERISVNGQAIDDNEIIKLTQIIKPIVEKLDKELDEGGPTEFEVVTAMMFKYFSLHQVDVVLVEVGIGGKYDSTNIITPTLSVITTIGYDHMKILGNSLTEIANQKAGIIKPNIPVVIGNVSRNPLKVIKSQAKRQRSEIHILNDNYFTQLYRSSGWQEKFKFKDDSIIFDNLKIDMLGDFQVDNAATAIESFIRYQGIYKLPINYSTIKHGLLNTFWPGRLEKLNDEPLVMIDGAHNEPAIQQISKVINERFSNNDFYIILAILADKQYDQMINTLASVKNVHLILTEFQGPGHRSAADLSQFKDKMRANFAVQFIDDWKEAIFKVASNMSSDDVLLITGSLYFISDVRKLFLNK